MHLETFDGREIDTTTGPVGVALALLEQQWPSCPALEDSIDTRAPAGLEGDPRYLIGRLQQALTVLLEQDLPPMDAQTALLSQALGDALAWRTHEGRPCAACDQSGEEFCGACTADWAQADRYHELARALGAVDDGPPSPAPAATPTLARSTRAPASVDGGVGHDRVAAAVEEDAGEAGGEELVARVVVQR